MVVNHGKQKYQGCCHRFRCFQRSRRAERKSNPKACRHYPGSSGFRQKSRNPLCRNYRGICGKRKRRSRFVLQPFAIKLRLLLMPVRSSRTAGRKVIHASMSTFRPAVFDSLVSLTSQCSHRLQAVQHPLRSGMPRMQGIPLRYPAHLLLRIFPWGSLPCCIP